MRRTAVDRLRFAWHDVRNFVRRVLEGAAESNVPFLASGLTFDAMLAAVPFIILVLAFVGHLLSAEAGRAQLEIQDYLRRFLPIGTAGGDRLVDQLGTMLADIVASRGTLGLLGFPLFIWFSTRLFGSLRACLCEIFDTEESRSILRGKLEDAVLVLVTGFLFVTNTAISAGVEFLARRNLAFGFIEFLGAQVLSFGMIVALFTTVFRYAPARRIRWDTALIAAVICSAGFEAAEQALSYYFTNWFRPDRLIADSTLAALLLLVAWTYYMALVFLLGAQIAQVYELRRRQAGQRLLLHG